MRSIILIAHNLRSCHNVGSLLRTAEGLGVDQVILSGYTPYPILSTTGDIFPIEFSTLKSSPDERMPHIAQKLHRQIQKTALGAETTQPWIHINSIDGVIATLRTAGYTLTAVEQSDTSIPLPDFNPPEKLALLVGREVEGVEPEILTQMDAILEIPMFGQKESFNVVQAAAMALYQVRFHA